MSLGQGLAITKSKTPFADEGMEEGPSYPVTPWLFFDANEEATGVAVSSTTFNDQSGFGHSILVHSGSGVEILDNQIDGQKACEFVQGNGTRVECDIGVGTLDLMNWAAYIVYKQIAHPGNDLGIVTFKPSSGSHAYNEDDGFVFETGTAADKLNIFGGAGSAFSLTDVALLDGWNLIALRMEAGSGVLYVNGSEITSTSYAGFGALSTGIIGLGAYWLGGTWANFATIQLAAFSLHNVLPSSGEHDEITTYYLEDRFPSIV